MGRDDDEVTTTNAGADPGRQVVSRGGAELSRNLLDDDVDEYIWHRRSSYDTWEEISAGVQDRFGVELAPRSCLYRYNSFVTKITAISPDKREQYRALMLDKLENLGSIFYRAIDPVAPDEKMANVVLKTIDSTARLTRAFEDDIRDRNVQNVAILVSSSKDAFLADLEKAKQAGAVVDDVEDEEEIL